MLPSLPWAETWQVKLSLMAWALNVVRSEILSN